MANQEFPTIPGTIEIPGDLGGFKPKPQVVWTASNWSYTSGVNIDYGPSAGEYWGGDANFVINRQENMYQPFPSSGSRFWSTAVTRERTTVFRMDGNSRWMPASVFNGIGFETYHQHIVGNQDHMLYVADYAVIFRHRSNNETKYYGLKTDYTSSPGHEGYRFDCIQTSDYHVDEIRTWGSEWLYQGLVVVLRTQGGGSDGSCESYIGIYNLKVGHKFSTVGSQYRYLPLKNRSAVNRDGTKDNKGFSNPFEE